MSSVVFFKISLTCVAVRLGFAANIKAARPAVIGDAPEVPVPVL